MVNAVPQTKQVAKAAVAELYDIVSDENLPDSE